MKNWVRRVLIKEDPEDKNRSYDLLPTTVTEHNCGIQPKPRGITPNSSRRLCDPSEFLCKWRFWFKNAVLSLCKSRKKVCVKYPIVGGQQGTGGGGAKGMNGEKSAQPSPSCTLFTSPQVHVKDTLSYAGKPSSFTTKSKGFEDKVSRFIRAPFDWLLWHGPIPLQFLGVHASLLLSPPAKNGFCSSHISHV